MNILKDKCRLITIKYKKELMDLFGNKCLLCGSTKNLNLHHDSYDGLTFEELTKSVRLLCRNCHDNQHKVIKQCKYCEGLFLSKTEDQAIYNLNKHQDACLFKESK